MTRLTVNELFMLRAAGPLAFQFLASRAEPVKARAVQVSASGQAPGLFARLATSASKGFTRARDRRRVIAQLDRMDDRLRRDIGLERGTRGEAGEAALE